MPSGNQRRTSAGRASACQPSAGGASAGRRACFFNTGNLPTLLKSVGLLFYRNAIVSDLIAESAGANVVYGCRWFVPEELLTAMGFPVFARLHLNPKCNSLCCGTWIPRGQDPLGRSLSAKPARMDAGAAQEFCVQLLRVLLQILLISPT